MRDRKCNKSSVLLDLEINFKFSLATFGAYSIFVELLVDKFKEIQGNSMRFRGNLRG